jgi:elongation factor G
MEPDPSAESGVRVSTAAIAGKLPAPMVEAIKVELMARGDGGGRIGSYPLTKLKISVLNAEMTEESTETAFSIAAGEAFEEGLEKGGPVLLEPVMRLSISTPDEYHGEFVGDLMQRRGRIVSTDSHGGMTFIEAHAPLAELFGYSNAMRSLSQGRAGSSMEPLEYAPAPANVVEHFGL